MQWFRLIVMLVLGLVTIQLGIPSVAAQGPDGIDPATIPYIDNQPHPLGAAASVWYRFGYGNSLDTGERPVATIRLVNGNHSGVVFEVWPPERVNNTSENKPVGHGTAMNMDCTTGVPSEQGQCQTTDLTWSGAFGASGTYFVRVINRNNNPVNFLLTIQGPTVSLPAPTPAMPVVPLPPVTVTTPPAIATPPVVVVPVAPAAPAEPPVIANMDDPNRATYMDNQPHRLAARTAVWYLFDYGTTNDLGDRLTASIRLINGKDTGVRFEVWTPESLVEWWTKQPVGRGTVSPADSADLSWRGGFSAGGTYLVRVVNDTDFTQTFLLVRE